MESDREEGGADRLPWWARSLLDSLLVGLMTCGVFFVLLTVVACAEEVQRWGEQINQENPTHDQ